MQINKRMIFSFENNIQIFKGVGIFVSVDTDIWELVFHW